jgi:DNA helicase-2/ATP-dependent DNA helicase PcrA
MVSWQEYQRRADALIEKQSGQIYELYERRLVQSNAMDFDDLLLNMITLLEKHPDVLEQFQDRFRYILVDEYQDTNRAQYKAVTLLASKLRNLCVVGDDAQSIYRWRGADIRNILDFQKDYPEATVVRLEQNYRSTKTILAAADSVIRNNRKQLPKTLWTDNTEGEKITLLACRDDREEAESVVRTIRERLLRANHSWRDAAILYRTNAQSQALEDALRRLNIPYHIVSGVSFYKRKEVKDALAYLRLIVNPSDSESLLRVINEPARGIGATSLERLQEEAARTSQTLYAVMQHADSIATVQKRTATAVKEFVDMIERYRLLMQEMTPASLAQSYIEATGLPKMYRSQDTEESLDRWNNIERLLSHIAEQQELNEELTLTQYLEQISLLSDADDPQLGNDRIALMTMHAAKGLEFPVVAIAGLEQGLFPLAKADQDPGEMEEERRLFYVGITRARNELILSYAERRYRFGELVFARPSTFLSEIDQQCFTASSAVMRSAGSGERAPHTAHGAPRTASRAPHSAHGAPRTAQGAPPTAHGAPTRSAAHLPKAPSAGSSAMSQGNEYDQTGDHASGLRVGMRVKHPMFGIGTVSGLSGTGQQAKATVQFITAGRKQLMLAYARLEII